ncbi:MAG: hypothetical protein AAGF95_20195 [Chloroflexota bacterium]
MDRVFYEGGPPPSRSPAQALRPGNPQGILVARIIGGAHALGLKYDMIAYLAGLFFCHDP